MPGEQDQVAPIFLFKYFFVAVANNSCSNLMSIDCVRIRKQAGQGRGSDGSQPGRGSERLYQGAGLTPLMQVTFYKYTLLCFKKTSPSMFFAIT